MQHLTNLAEIPIFYVKNLSHFCNNVRRQRGWNLESMISLLRKYKPLCAEKVKEEEVAEQHSDLGFHVVLS